MTLSPTSIPSGHVDPGYRHVTKVLVPGEPLVLPQAFLKWYDLRRADLSMAEGIDAQARAFLADQVTSEQLPFHEDLGFVINHLSGQHIYLLLVFTWRNDNEMWESAYVRDTREDGGFVAIPVGFHRPTICVWECGAVTHEHRAWSRYLGSDRGDDDRRAYVADQYAGPIH